MRSVQGLGLNFLHLYSIFVIPLFFFCTIRAPCKTTRKDNGRSDATNGIQRKVSCWSAERGIVIKRGRARERETQRENSNSKIEYISAHISLSFYVHPHARNNTHACVKESKKKKDYTILEHFRGHRCVFLFFF